jgi:uncharacterized cupin superfamily protein
MPKLDLAAIPFVESTGYPGSLAECVRGRSYQRLTEAAGLTQFGVNICRLQPGAASSIRHWHKNEDEFVMMLEGELILIENEGETVMRPGDCAGFKAGVANGHHLVNRSCKVAALLVIGTRAKYETAHYPDVDLHFVRDASGSRYTHKDGTAY